jgi:O-acetyl-ADP-ribose deacetylase (regulator of RNase III)
MKKRINILQCDITTLDVDAIVNAANHTLLGGGGVDGAIHRAAGPDLKGYCAGLGGCEKGDAEITPGFNLNARYVIHTVGPIWKDGAENERKLLASAYRRSLEGARDNDIKSIAFPSISTGVYGFPFEPASRIAIREILTFLATSAKPENVILVTFSDGDFLLMQKIFEDV